LRQVIDSPAAYIGMIGSHRRASAVMQHIRDSGVPLERITGVRSPIGLHIGAETPAEIAVSVVAEMIMARHGGTGRPMSEVERLSVR
jgi:xanthine dehydrogenase accessory factor